GALPGVEAVGLVEDVLQRRNPDGMIAVEGRPPAPPMPLSWDGASPAFFRPMGARLLRWRFFTDDEGSRTAPRAIINEPMTRHFWTGEDPVGRRFKAGDLGSSNSWMTVVGVVADMRRQGLEKAAPAHYVRPFLNVSWADLVVRTASDPAVLAPSVRSEIRA